MVYQKRKPVVLVILDGWGVTDEKRGNAITLAKTPVIDEIWRKYASTLLSASGKDVGLPPGQNGNSEAGHMNIGAGRIVEQDSVLISRSINDGTFFRNAAFLTAIGHVRQYKSNLHLIGLLTAEQSAHADPDQLLALLTLFRLRDVNNIHLHLFTDGRDSYQYLAVKLLERLKKILINHEKIVTICGRFYAMDRNREWERTKLAYEALVLGKGHQVKSAQEAVLQAYNRQENDEYIKPTVVSPRGRKEGRISDNDTVVFFNLRSDRVRQLTKAFTQKKFEGFERDKVLKNLCFVTLTDFGPDLPGVLSAYPARFIKNTLPFALESVKQLYIAETEKYAHMTYFFNGGYDHSVAGEDRIIINSPHVYSYKEKPEMSANKITEVIVKGIKEEQYDFIAVNYANPDMVAHTGDLNACIKAVESVDRYLGQIKKAVLEKDGTMIITADHGNIEEVIDIGTDQIDTAHSGHPVPLIIVNKNIPKETKVQKGVLADIAPTILYMMDIKKPKEMNNKILCPFRINQRS